MTGPPSRRPPGDRHRAAGGEAAPSADDGWAALSLSERRLPGRFERRRILLPPGQALAYDESMWRDALVVVERGRVALEDRGGGRRYLTRADVLWLDGLPLRALHNAGTETVVLVAVSRRTAAAEPDLQAEEPGQAAAPGPKTAVPGPKTAVPGPKKAARSPKTTEPGQAAAPGPEAAGPE